MSIERKVLVDVTGRSHTPHKKRNISSAHTMQKATIEFKARGGKCQCTKQVLCYLKMAQIGILQP